MRIVENKNKIILISFFFLLRNSIGSYKVINASIMFMFLIDHIKVYFRIKPNNIQ